MPDKVKSTELTRVDNDPDGEMVIGDTGRNHLSRVDVEEDRSRLRSGAALLNTFNFAIQEQAGRKHWTEADFHRFIRAYVAIDGIGRQHTEKS
jgi:hypothetical protein